MGKAFAAHSGRFPTAERDPACALQFQRLPKTGLPGAIFVRARRERDAMSNLAVDDHFYFSDWFLTEDSAAHLAGCNLAEEHWASRHKTTAFVQSSHPCAEIEPVRQANVNAAESKRDGMHATGRAGGRAQAEAAIEQRPIGAMR